MKKPDKVVPQCPLIQGECVEAGCTFWITLSRKPLGQAKEESFGNCTVTALPALIVENTQQTLRLQAAIESIRNSMLAEVCGSVKQSLMEVASEVEQRNRRKLG